MSRQIDWGEKDLVILREWPTGMDSEAIGRLIGVSGPLVRVRVRKLREMGHDLAHRGYGQHPKPTGIGLTRDAPRQAPTAGDILTVRTCRWLDGEPRHLRYCGDAVKPGSSYCPDHHARCYVPNSRLPDGDRRS